jgi:hypothetical protein
MSTICMKLDPGMHIGMHLVCLSKTGCDRVAPRRWPAFRAASCVAHWERAARRAGAAPPRPAGAARRLEHRTRAGAARWVSDAPGGGRAAAGGLLLPRLLHNERISEMKGRI